MKELMDQAATELLRQIAENAKDAGPEALRNLAEAYKLVADTNTHRTGNLR